MLCRYISRSHLKRCSGMINTVYSTHSLGYQYTHHYYSSSSTQSNQAITQKENTVRRIIDLVLNGTKYKNTIDLIKSKESNINSNGVDNVSIKDDHYYKLIKEINVLKNEVDRVDIAKKQLQDYDELVQLARVNSDKEMMEEASTMLNDLHQDCIDLEWSALMDEELDNQDCYLELHSGAGGVDAMDWTTILSEMYDKWAERRGWKVSVLDWASGDHPNTTKRRIVKYSGPYAYGWCKSEMGVHKLIRLSPFDTSGKRHTSFASVVVYRAASIDSPLQIELPSRDLTIETMRSSGAGGQHVNKTESAVRITHIPTGYSVHVSEHRSQHQNKSLALELLKEKLMAVEMKKRADKDTEMRNSLGTNGWASDSIVRTYTFHPQVRIKDQRTGMEVLNDLDSILNGTEELDLMVKLTLSTQSNQK